jgi:hypothetical protein
MKFTQWFTNILSVILACVMSCGISLLISENSWAAPNLLSEIPENPILATPDRNKAIGNFAWQTFVALNWPANCDGSPKSINIGEDEDSAPAPRIWEFYHFPEDVFKPNGERPDPNKLVIPTQCLPGGVQPANRQLKLTEFGENPIARELASNLTPLGPGIIGESGYVLVDRWGNYVLNESRMNPAEVQQIVKKGWYSADKLKQESFNNVVGNNGNPFQLLCSSREMGGVFPEQPPPPPGKAPCIENGKMGTTPKDNTSMGAIELKAAWMVLPDSGALDPNVPSPNPKKFYTTEVKLSVDSSEGKQIERKVRVALIGFHILHKTSQTGWVWSTFEHVDNAPDRPDGNKLDYNLYNPNSTGKINTPSAINTDGRYFWGDKFPYAVTKNHETQNFEPQKPAQIIRQVPIPPFATSLNAEWKIKLNESVLQNYQLIGVQWLASPRSPYPIGGMGPNVDPDIRNIPGLEERNPLINVALEPFPKDYGRDGFSCVRCHIGASLPNDRRIKSDFSFLMSHAQ